MALILQIRFLSNVGAWSTGLWLLDAVVFVGLVGTVIYAWDVTELRGLRRIWQVGFGALMLGFLLDMFTDIHYGFLIHVNMVYPVIGISLYWWLARRFSDLPLVWLNLALRNTTAYLLISGTLLLLAETSVIPSQIPAYVNPVLLVIVIAHVYKPLSERNLSRTLAAHWGAFGALLYLLVLGIPGALRPLVAERLLLDNLAYTLSLMGTAAILLGVVNQVAVELRGVNRRVTGLLPFWCVSGGTLGFALATYTAGMLLTLVQEPSAGLIRLGTIGLGFVLAGMVWYTIAFFIRRVDLDII